MQRNFKRRRQHQVIETSNFSNAAPTEIKEREILFNSIHARSDSTTSTYNFDLPFYIRDTTALTISSFNFFNTFYNVKAGFNTIQWTSDAINFTTTFTEGYWSSGLGTVTLAEATASLTTGLNDVRYHILRSSIGSTLIDSVTLNPINNHIEIVFAQTAVPAEDTVDIVDSTVNFGLGTQTVAGRLASDVTVSGNINLKSTSLLQLCSSEFDAKFNGTGATTTGASVFGLIPVNSRFGYREKFQPNAPITVKYESPLKMMKQVSIQFRDQDGALQPMRESWVLVLKVNNLS
jgi:hypothetical protein